jgi:hypothetical protein
LPGKKLVLFLEDKYRGEYNIQVKDIYHELAGKLASNMKYEDFDIAGVGKNTATMVLKQGEKATTLAEVIVKSNNREKISGFGLSGINRCGDYVCLFGVLNCYNHHTGTQPVKGATYKRFGSGSIVYGGCMESEKENTFMVFLKGIYSAKEFYNTDYSTVSSSEQMFLSTIYWNYSEAINSDKPTELSFFTSDIAGKFRVVVQGVTTGGVVHGEYVFTVKKE